jgi:hypothetical protein
VLISKCGRTLLQLVCLMPGLEGWVQRSSIAEHTAPYLDAHATGSPPEQSRSTATLSALARLVAVVASI